MGRAIGSHSTGRISAQFAKHLHTKQGQGKDADKSRDKLKHKYEALETRKADQHRRLARALSDGERSTAASTRGAETIAPPAAAHNV